MKVLYSAALATLVAGSAPALALDFGNGFTLSGEVELEYLTNGSGEDESFGFADVTLGWRSQGGGQMGFGFDLTLVDYEDLTDSESVNTFWGGLVLTTGFGEVTVGNPRPLLKTMIDTPDIGGIRVFNFEISSITGSSLEVLALFADFDMYGISFKGGTGPLSYGASYHQIDAPGPEIDAIELAVNYQIGKTLIQGGVEVLDNGVSSAEKLLLGATYVEDRWSAGAMLTKATQGSTDVTAIKLFGDYSISEAFSVGAQVLTLDVDGSDSQTFYGISGEYGFGPGGFAQLGVFSSDNSGADEVYSASIGYRF
jgi:hypothetical protein